MNQRYVSKYLTHFVARSKIGHEFQYDVFCEILRTGWLVSGAMIETPLDVRDERIQQVAYGLHDKIRDLGINDAFTSEVVCFADIPSPDYGLHMEKYIISGWHSIRSSYCRRARSPSCVFRKTQWRSANANHV